MALIICPECKREISDQAAACPHCGCPITKPAPDTETTVQQSPQIEQSKPKKKGIMIAAVALVVLVAVVFAGVQISKKRAEEARLEALAQARSEYIQTLKDTHTAMLKGAAEAENACNLMNSVWYNAIYEKTDSETDPYTKVNGKFVDDFNDALSNLFSSEVYKGYVTSITTTKSSVEANMKNLQSPPEGLETAYDTLCDLYASFSTFTGLALSPSGSLKTFSDSFSTVDNDFMALYNKLDTQIPEE